MAAPVHCISVDTANPGAGIAGRLRNRQTHKLLSGFAYDEKQLPVRSYPLNSKEQEI
jgi:hypothetical protein